MSQMVVNRVFYLNVGSIHPMDIPSYVEAVKTALQMQTNDDGNQFVAVMQKEGRWEDLFIPVRTAATGPIYRKAITNFNRRLRAAHKDWFKLP
jgi:hypothetical protein